MTPDEAHELYLREIAVLEAEGQSANATRDANNLFFGYPYDDYIAALRAVRDEVEERAYLAIVAATEGVLQQDFRARTRMKARVPLSKTARTLLRNREKDGRRVELEDILDAWAREVLGLKAVIGEFKQLMTHRHWLAHGRYFVDKCGVPTGPDFAYARACTLLDQLRNVDPAFPLRLPSMT
ncbi:MAG: hypothetical protein H6718_07685 [Polyangiaceae bacterium]|nr:hypothetical protein [Polyangiaceae bacterium]